MDAGVGGLQDDPGFGVVGVDYFGDYHLTDLGFGVGGGVDAEPHPSAGALTGAEGDSHFAVVHLEDVTLDADTRWGRCVPWRARR